MDIEICNRHGERIDTTWTPGTTGDNRVVVIGHGVTANKDRPFLQGLSSALAESGIASLRFSFSGNGASDGRFEDATVTKEVEDLGFVLDALGGRPVIYAGHSMGAAVGVLRAARDGRIRALVSLAGMVDTANFVDRKFGHLTPGRDFMWDLPECPLSQAYVDDLRGIGSVAGTGSRITVPWLLVHGDADDVVPIREAHDIREAAGGRPELVVLEGVDHVFSGDGSARMTGSVVPWVAGELRA